MSSLPARLVFGIAGLAALAAPAKAGSKPGSPRPNIVLIVLDTVRADAVALEGPRRGVRTPFLEDWSKKALVYRAALSPADSTSESHFSMFTGFPSAAFGTTADTPALSVVAQLNAAGYDTVGISANPLVHPSVLNAAKPFQTFETSPYVSPEPLHARVFETLEHFQVPPHYDGWGVEKTSAKTQSSAAEINARLDALLSACARPTGAARPLFLFVNLLDAHDPYLPPGRFSPSSEELWAHWPVNGDLRSGPRREETPRGDHGVPEWRNADRFSRDEIRYLRSLYDREIRYLDSQLAVLFEILRRHGILEKAVVVVTADHGEAFGEQGYLMHHLESFGVHVPELYRVPLAIRGYGFRLETREPKGEPFTTARIADSIRSWAGIARGPGPELDPIAVVQGAAAPKREAPRIEAGVTRPAQGEPPRKKSAEERAQDEELARRLRSLGYIR